MNLKYRPEIDGLRAISVIAVLIYHSDLSFFGKYFFNGGFIGVDIFFIISGYLIGSIIINELKNTGKFSYINFLTRRVRRILPVLFFIIIASLIFSYFFLLPKDFIDLSESILSSILFGSNYYFSLLGEVYDAVDSKYLPFLHTWSLSVEEQFYIIFPIILVLIFKFYKKYFVTVLFFILLFSFLFAYFSSVNYPIYNFYSLPSRAWEILLGVILAHYEIKKGGFPKIKNKLINNTIIFLGFILILSSFYFYNEDMLLPSYPTLMPLFGTSILIVFTGNNDFITKILSNKVMVFFGLISYSLYLWHYPIFSFSYILEFSYENVSRRLIFCTIILSIITYLTIEKPFRNKKKISNKLLWTTVLSLFLIIIITAFLVIKNDGFKKRFSRVIDLELRNEKLIVFNRAGEDGNIVLIGDSHAEALEFNLNKELIKNNLNLFRFKTELYLPEFDMVNRKTLKKVKYFNINNESITAFLKENKNLIVLIHNRYALRFLETKFDNKEGGSEFTKNNKKNSEYYFQKKINYQENQAQREILITKQFNQTINFILDLGHKVILIYPVPELGFDPVKSISLSLRKEKKVSSKAKFPILTVNYDVFKKRNDKIIKILSEVKNKNLHRVYPHTFFCNTLIQNRCVTNNENKIYYWDDDHLSLDGSKFVINEIIKKINTIK
jgi:peptidoglycan/LPS O-acetylase OafA/YrhL